MPIPIEHNPVTADDLQIMFKLLAGIDGHPRSVDDIDIWLIAAQAGRWTRAQVAAATLALARDFRGFRIMPGHVNEQIAADREQIRARWYCPDPPRHLADDPRAEIQWRRRMATDYSDRALIALATGSPLDEVPLVLDAEPDQADLPDARERIAQICSGIGDRLAVVTTPVDRRPRRLELDPARLADARAELDTARGRREDAS